jgi:hypothetical protein
VAVGCDALGAGPQAPASRASASVAAVFRIIRSVYTGGSATVPAMREEPRRIGGRLEATLRIPDRDPSAIAVIAHPLPTHGGSMRNPLIAAVARAAAERGLCALRFNFRGTGESAGEFTHGQEEERDLADAVADARAAVPGVPLCVAGFSFGALMLLKWLSHGGVTDAYALLGLPLRSVSLAPQDVPPVPDAAFIVQGEHDQFGTAAEVRARLPHARVVEVPGVDHFFVERRTVQPGATGPAGALRDRYREVARIVVDQLARDARLA